MKTEGHRERGPATKAIFEMLHAVEAFVAFFAVTLVGCMVLFVYVVGEAWKLACLTQRHGLMEAIERWTPMS